MTRHRGGGWLLLLAVGIGVVDTLVFLGFEWTVDRGTDWIWNDLAGSEHRWRVVALATLLGVAGIMILALLPIELIGVAAAGVAGAAIATRALDRVVPDGGGATT